MLGIVVISCFLFTQTAAGESVKADTMPVRIGLALSGGAALGLAHIGVLKVLEREQIPISFISGNSMGSMVGGTYAAGYTAAEIESIALSEDWTHLFSSSVPFGAQYLPERQQNQKYILRIRHKNFFPSLPSGLIPLQNVEFLMMKLFSEIEYNTGFDFDSLPVPYRTVTVNLATGKKVILKRGRLEQAIRASIAIPGVFAPEIIDSGQLVDGGVQQYLPVDPLFEFQPDFIIAVLTMKKNEETGISLIDIISRTMDVVTFEDLIQQKKYADVLIEPDVDPFSHSDFPAVAELIAVGETATETAMPAIRSRLAGRKLAAPQRKITARPLPIVRAIRIEGLEITHKSMVTHDLRTRVGHVLNFNDLIDDMIALFNTGLFDDINYRLELDQKDSVDVVIELIERDYGYYAAGIRYDNANNLSLGLEVGQGNLGGSGAGIRAVVNLGDPNEYRFGLTGTRLFMLPFGYRIDGFWNSIDRSYYEQGDWQGDYNMNQRGGIMAAGYILGRNAFFNLGITGYQVLYRLPPVAAFDSTLRREWIVGPIFNLEFNDLNNLYIPTEGLTYELSLMYSTKTLNGSKEFLKLAFSLEQFVPLSSRILIHPGFELGTSLGELSWSEYFYAGSDNLIGFHHEEFTTEQQLILHLGIDFKLFNFFNQRDYPLYFQLLSNAATFKSWKELSDLTDISSEDFHISIGAGLRTNTPVGPFNIVFGVGDFHMPNLKDNLRYGIFVSLGRDFRYTK